MDDVSREAGAMELVRGSHKWHHSEPEGAFHGPEDYRRPMLEAAAREGIEPDIVYVAVPRGGGSIHHGWTWHGSGPNAGTTPRRSLVLHAMSSEVEFAPDKFGQGTGPIYGRYRRLGDNSMDESHFPILWARDGRRTAHLDAYCVA